ncbi:hypothetical protein Chor_011432 [Crotalus horridus]
MTYKSVDGLQDQRPWIAVFMFSLSSTGEGDLPSLCSQCQHKLQESPSQLLPALLLSTVPCCKHEEQTCLQVYVALNSTGIGGLELDFLVASSNRYGRLQWQMQFDSFQVASGEQVHVSVKTIPPGMLKLNQSYAVTDNQPGPEFRYRWIPAARAIEVSASKAVTVRLCHQLMLECTELHQSFHQQVLVSKHRPAVLQYEFLLPCLCIEVCASSQEALSEILRSGTIYAADLWSSACFHDFSSSDRTEMAVSLSGRCFFQPTVSLCWKENSAPEATCQDIPNSTIPEASKVKGRREHTERDENNKVLWKKKVEGRMVFAKGISLSGRFQESLFHLAMLAEEMREKQASMPFQGEDTESLTLPIAVNTTWNVSLSEKFLQLHLNFHSRTPASFSSALCQPISSSHCRPEPSVYTISHVSDSRSQEEEFEVVSRNISVMTIGPDKLCTVSQRRWGLLAFAVVLGLGLLALAIFLIHWNMHKLRRDAPGRHHSCPILLIYSPDSEEHKQLVCSFAALLRSALGCPVLLDLWELGHVGRLGILPWVYAQRELVGRKQGQVLLLWSAGSARAYGLWQGEASSHGRKAPEPYDLFGAAMACLQSELQGVSGTVQRCDWVIAYFNKLCDRRDIPRALRLLPRYRLPQDLPDLVGVLQGNSSSGPSWLHASAKALVCHLLKAEKKRSSRKQRNQPWSKNVKRLEESLFPLAQLKVHRPSCT